MFNERNTYTIIDENNNIVEEFRTKSLALYMLPSIQKNHYTKLEITKVK